MKKKGGGSYWRYNNTESDRYTSKQQEWERPKKEVIDTK
jgi:hypothetical protein